MRCYELRNRHNSELMTPALNFVFVEMGRMKLGLEDEDKCNTLLEKFIFSLKYMHLQHDVPEDISRALNVPLEDACPQWEALRGTKRAGDSTKTVAGLFWGITRNLLIMSE